MDERAQAELERELIIYSDGASRGNPGPAGIGAVILDENESVVAQISAGVGVATNNEAEYLAIAKALETAQELGARRVRVYVDSELVARQLSGQYAVKSERLRPLVAEVQRLRRLFDSCPVRHVRREMNAKADQLANMGIDGDLGLRDPSD
ncbi:MAG: ribonuclease HI family protein [Firmicutes bacterium]|jgi:ribonuclease HI|nr:ribonuclease HI family protein [Bacillota bacterium]MDH7496113.1 ribonuclease HI family protein [Bacillota bacterium]